MSTEDRYTHMPMLDVDGESPGPGVYVADPGWLAEVCARNAANARARAAAAQATQDGEQA